MGRHADAAVAARELPRLAPDDAGVLLRAARLLAGCVGLAKRDTGLPWGVGLALEQAYGGEAVSLARAAVTKARAGAAPLLSDPDFDPVRSRDDFLLFDGLTDPKK
jgi:hypothetical protein